jgi:hypothetical protein
LSYAGAQEIAAAYPQYADQITAAAQESFLQGDQLAYLAGLGAVLIGIGLTFLLFPRKDDELRMRAEFLAEDEVPDAAAGPTPANGQAPERQRSPSAAVAAEPGPA